MERIPYSDKEHSDHLECQECLSRWFRFRVCTCSNKFSIQFGGSQSRASVMHGPQHSLLQLLWLSFNTQALLQAGGRRRGALGTAAAMQRDHTQDASQNCQTQVRVVWRRGQGDP